MAGKLKRILVLMLCIGLLAVTIAGCKKQDQVIDSSSVSEVSKEIETSSDNNSEAAEPETFDPEKQDPIEFAKEILAANPEISETELRVKLYKAGFTPAEIKAAAEAVMPKTEESKDESSKQDESSKTESSSEESSEESKKEESSKKDESAESTETEEESGEESSKIGSGNSSSESSKQQESSKTNESSKPSESSKPEESSKQESSKQEESKQESKAEESKTEESKPETSQQMESSKTEDSKQESQTNGCEHNWVDVTTTVHHDEVGHYETVVTKEAWDEVIVIQEGWSEEVDTGEYCYQCLGCGATFEAWDTESLLDHCADEGASYWSAPVYETVYHDAVTETVHHEAETEQQWIVDQAAYDETVVTGQKCSKCGEKK